MKAEILAIGSELTCGSRLDTNSQWLSRELESLGWTVVRHTTLADDLEAISTEIRSAPQRSDLLLITGGLGPTLDDLTRDAMAAAFAQPLVRDLDAVRQIQDLFAARGREMPQSNLRQADRPRDAQTLHNSCGTAPGILLQVDRSDRQSPCLIAAMPGVPAEMRVMFEQQIRPQLPESSVALCRKVIRSFGFGESEAEQRLGDLTARGRNPEVGITASEAVISFWISARAPNRDSAAELCLATEQEVRLRLGDAVYGDGDTELYEVLLQLLQQSSARIAVLEGAATGGQIGLWMSADARSETVLHEASLVRPTTALAERQQPQDSTFEQWQDQVRSQCHEYFGSHAVNGILLSSGYFDEQQPSGVIVRRGMVAAATPDEIQFRDVSMSGNLRIFRQRAGRTAINLLRLSMLHQIRP